MKKLSCLLLLLVALLVMPFVYAEGEETTATEEQDSRVTVYFFHGDGCPHCEEATEWFNSIKDEYGSKFKIIRYETWKNSDNSELMQKVAEFRSDDASGVPYIIIGDQSWIGFASDTMGPEIKEKIDEVYQQPLEERYDAVYLANDGVIPPGDPEVPVEEEAKSNDVVALIIILIVVGAGCFGIYKARNAAN